LIEAGLDGIEIHHRDNAEDEKSQLIDIARQYDLVITGSSDYHGTGKMNRLAEFTTSPEEWERLEARARERRVISK
jgi:predicted metal-dependent phosphoesterase TrpH